MKCHRRRDLTGRHPSSRFEDAGWNHHPILRGRVIDVTDTTYTMELTGDGDKLDAFLRALDPKVLLEVVRSGANGIARGERSLRA